MGYFRDGNGLTARDALTEAFKWQFNPPEGVTSAAIVVNGHVYVGSATGRVWALDARTGTVAWTDLAGAPVLVPDEHNVTGPLTGLGAGQGLVVVPATNLLVAYAGPNGVVGAKPRPLSTWGGNKYGQLGSGTITSRSRAATVGRFDRVPAGAAGFVHSLVADADGAVWAWGSNAGGQLGDGTTVDRPSPVRVPGLPDVVAVAAGVQHSLAVGADGSVWSWGANGYGQLGDGSFTGRRSPVQVPAMSGVVAVAAGYYHSLALTEDGILYAWGLNHVGQLGFGPGAPQVVPWPSLAG